MSKAKRDSTSPRNCRQLAREIKRAEDPLGDTTPVGVPMLDIDHFKGSQ